jgi:hypothetical protein
VRREAAWFVVRAMSAREPVTTWIIAYRAPDRAAGGRDPRAATSSGSDETRTGPAGTAAQPRAACEFVTLPNEIAPEILEPSSDGVVLDRCVAQLKRFPLSRPIGSRGEDGSNRTVRRLRAAAGRESVGSQRGAGPLRTFLLLARAIQR